MFKKKNELDTNGLNEVIYLSKNILKLSFVILIIGIILASFILLKEVGVFKFIGSLLNVLSPLFIGFVVAWLFVATLVVLAAVPALLNPVVPVVCFEVAVFVLATDFCAVTAVLATFVF